MITCRTVANTAPPAADPAAGAPGQPSPARQLAALLVEHRDEIAAAWAAIARSLPGTRYASLTADELSTSTWSGVGAIAEALDTGSCTAVVAYLSDVTRARLHAGFAIGEITQVLMACHDAALPVVRGAFPPASPLPWDMLACLDACLRQVVGQFVDLYSAEDARLLRQQQAATAALLDLARAAGSTLDLDAVLSLVSRAMATAFDSRFHCLVALVDEEQQAFVFRRAAISDTPTQATAASLGYFDRAIPFAQTDRFSLDLVEHKRPLTTYDAEHDTRILTDRVRRWGSKSWLGLPFIVNDEVVAVCWLTTTEEHHAFSQEELDLAQGIANVVALALQNARLYQQVKEQAIYDERRRLAGEMHDDLSQMLGSLNWRLSTVDRLLSTGAVDSARLQLLELKRIAKQGYAEVRESLFTLRSASSVESEFLPALESYLADYRARHGLRTELVVDVPSFPRFPVAVRLQIIRIVQEALANVRKHAAARCLRILFSQDGDCTQITVEDDGHGFDLARLQEEGRQHFGLSVMHERAAAIGGTLAVVSAPGAGTRIVLRLPMYAAE